MRSLAVLMIIMLLTAVPGDAAVQRHVLYDGGSSYPRVIRLDNGRVLASVTTNDGPQGVGVIMASDDDGRTFQQIATIRDPAAVDGRGVCCSTLFELPSPLGALPQGTVLWASTAGHTAPLENKRVKQRLWASADRGQTWRFLSDIAAAPNEQNTWEPSLSVAADGSLVAFFSDETDKYNHDQKLVQVRSVDGLQWTHYKETVVSDVWGVRPGMINAIRLPDGSYFMTYEVCNNDKVHLCSAYFRRSPDGWNYGDPRDLGTLVKTADGKQGRHTPVPAWSPGPGPKGTILLITEMLVHNGGKVAEGNGGTILANDNLGDGPWYEIPAPIHVVGVDNEGCRNFSPGLLPSKDGKSVLQVTTDYDQSICKTYYATGPLERQQPAPAPTSPTPGG
nr:sialidase family protein [Kibdelosporangium sp. MJ126-NF4]CEL20505.1 bifunctional protein (secreted sugar binding protein/sugar hydrolase) [Kibdelosporangium sp. MJ126-NF4]CTQ97729.1 bifunctional protein (secreted sugar binding protein/sugar hydrolase) [Kibdelosporangium sp. MJ126-NF4]